MAADRRRAERIMLPRRFPTHVIGRIVGYLIISGIAAAGVMLLFGEEPRRLASERINPLAFLPYVLVVVLALGLIPMLVSLFRRPLVSADHYSLTVRPGILRTLVLPWARISELAIYSVTLRDDPEPLLLVRCVEWHSPLGDNPGWWDQRVWRAAAKSAGGAIGGYDVAVRLSEFSGEAGAHLDAIGAFAPERVSVVDRTGSPGDHDTPKGKKGKGSAKAARPGARGGVADPGRATPGPVGPDETGPGEAGRRMRGDGAPGDAGHWSQGEAGRGPQDSGWRGRGDAEDWQDDPTTELHGPPRTRHGRFRSRRSPTSGPPATGIAPGASASGTPPAPGMPPGQPPYGPDAPPDAGRGRRPVSGPPGADPAAQDPPTEYLHLGDPHEEAAPPRTTQRGRRAERRQPRAESGRRGRRGQPEEPATEQFSPSAYLPPAEDFDSEQFSPSAYLPPAGDFGSPDSEPTTRFSAPGGPPGSPAAASDADNPPTEQLSGAARQGPPPPPPPPHGPTPPPARPAHGAPQSAGAPPAGPPGWSVEPPSPPPPGWSAEPPPPPGWSAEPGWESPPPGPPGSSGPSGWGAPPQHPPPDQPPPYGAAAPPGPLVPDWPEEWPPENLQTDRTQALPPSGQAGQYHQPRYPGWPYGEPEPYDEPTQDRRPYPPPPGRH